MYENNNLLIIEEVQFDIVRKKILVYVIVFELIINTYTNKHTRELT